MWDPKICSRTTIINTAHGQSDDRKENPARDSGANTRREQVKSRRKKMDYSINNSKYIINIQSWDS